MSASSNSYGSESTIKWNVVCVVHLMYQLSLCARYLQSEWELRRGSVREFSSEQMQGSHCKVPLQDNSSDCGLYLLQYVESFLQVTVHME